MDGMAQNGPASTRKTWHDWAEQAELAVYTRRQGARRGRFEIWGLSTRVHRPGENGALDPDLSPQRTRVCCSEYSECLGTVVPDACTSLDTVVPSCAVLGHTIRTFRVCREPQCSARCAVQCCQPGESDERGGGRETSRREMAWLGTSVVGWVSSGKKGEDKDEAVKRRERDRRRR